MTSKIHESFTLYITPVSDRKDRLIEKKSVSGELRFIIGESPEESKALCDDVHSFLEKLPEIGDAIESLLAGNEIKFEFLTSKKYLTPLADRDGIEIGSGHSTGDDELYIELGVVETEAFVTEMYSTLREWHDEALDINPDLKNEEWCQDLENALAAAQQAMEEVDIEVPS